MDNLRQQGHHMVQTVVLNLKFLLNFAENAVTVEQLDRVIDVMDTVGVLANNIIKPPPPPPHVDEDEDDAQSSITS